MGMGGQMGGYGGSPYSVQNIIQRDRMMGSYNPYSMGMVPNYATTSYMNPYSSPYSRPYFPQTTGSFFRSNAPAYGFYGQPETFGMPGPGYPDPFNVNPYSPYNVMGGPAKGAPQQGYNPYGMYGNQGGFTPSGRPPPQMGGKGGAGGGKGGGRIYNMYDGTRFGDEVPPSPYSEYASKEQAYAESAGLKEQARLEAERLAARRPNEADDKPLRPRR